MKKVVLIWLMLLCVAFVFAKANNIHVTESILKTSIGYSYAKNKFEYSYDFETYFPNILFFMKDDQIAEVGDLMIAGNAFLTYFGVSFEMMRDVYSTERFKFSLGGMSELGFYNLEKLNVKLQPACCLGLDFAGKIQYRITKHFSAFFRAKAELADFYIMRDRKPVFMTCFENPTFFNEFIYNASIGLCINWEGKK